MPDPRDKAPVGTIFSVIGILVLIIWSVVGYYGYAYYKQYTASQKFVTTTGGFPLTENSGAPDPELPTVKPLPDADALAKRLPELQDTYAKVRDEALAGYLDLHPAPAAYDDEARATLRLMAYLSVYSDVYGEGLWQQCEVHVKNLANEGANFTVFSQMVNSHTYWGQHSSDAEGAAQLTKEVVELGATKYPALFKLRFYRLAIGNLTSAHNDPNVQPPVDVKDFSHLTDLATQTYAELIREHLPGPVLYAAADELLESAEGKHTTLETLSTGIDRAFAAEDKDNPLAQVLDGLFEVDDAWSARGSGYANTVSDSGWRLFNERLAKANQILTDLYASHPEVPQTPRVMMTVVLGQSGTRDEMEKWFQRGVKLNKENFSLYMAKRWYLLPRWFGSADIVWNFGLECAQSDDWAARTPLLLVEAIDDAGSDNPGVYAQPDVWTPVEKVFRDYLDHYPTSQIYRSRFLKCAVEGGHWDIAIEQMKILGDDWDRATFPGDEYRLVRKLVADHMPAGK